MVGQTYQCRYGVDPSDHRIKNARTRPTRLLPGEGGFGEATGRGNSS
jgi:hypothetical protein